MSWHCVVPIVVAGLTIIAACSDGSKISPPTKPPVPSGPVVRTIEIPTYDGSGQTVHPDHALVRRGVGTLGEPHLAITPYPFGNAALENPSLFYAPEAGEWRIPPGVVNPVVRPRVGHLSDPDLVYDPDRRELLLYYRAVEGENAVYLIRSPDAAHWSAPLLVASAPNHRLVSPSVVRRDPTEWYMWSINGFEGCSAASAVVELRRSTDGLVWSSPELVSLNQPGFSPWHIEVQWIQSRGEYWALFNAKTAHSCTTPALFFATSPDGIKWTTYPSPVLARGWVPAFEDIVYRSTFFHDPLEGTITFWFSGATFANGRYVWRTATQRRSVIDFFEAVQAASSDVIGPSDAPPLVDPP